MWRKIIHIKSAYYAKRNIGMFDKKTKWLPMERGGKNRDKSKTPLNVTYYKAFIWNHANVLRIF